MDAPPPGTAHVKPEYLLPISATVVLDDDDAAEGATGRTRGAGVRGVAGDGLDGDGEVPPVRTKRTKAQKRAQNGANKGRRFGKVVDGIDLCFHVAAGEGCEFGERCRNNHDVRAYLAAKPPDIVFPHAADVERLPLPNAIQADADSTASRPPVCPVFEETGECRFGYRCRFLGAHIRPVAPVASLLSSGNVPSSTDADHTEPALDFELVQDAEKLARSALTSAEANRVSGHTLKLLRTKKYPFPITTAYQKELAAAEGGAANPKLTPGAGALVFAEPDQEDHDVAMPAAATPVAPPTANEEPVLPTPSTAAAEATAAKPDADALIAQRTAGAAPPDAVDGRFRFREKNRLDWAGKTYLAPLTTVGNLPFRRLCVSYGADITCGEMGLATSFLSGSKEEWSLVRRHPSERTFGVQLAGSKVASVVAAAEALAGELGDGVDFVDLNCGCPIDLVFKTGSGSALLDNPNRLGKLVRGMSRALGAVPVTVKLRTGVKDGRNTVHKLMPRLGPEFGAGGLTLHGRTRQQRYTKLADWAYIKECVDAVRAREVDEDIPRVPIFGGGDAFSAAGYWDCVSASGVDGVMVARGALIKPWIFTEIKERREWDISARERLEGVRRYAEYGLTHFGTDTAGLNSARRYLCEALSFQYRYVPIGILETLPARINDRAPAFRGRDELETLLASPDSRDWVRISEMFLGPAPAAWNFTPKHRSNAYEAQG
ncbi:zinc finger dihydrouridine synthase [Mycena belliarum]|uniref:tRNA-dihydrouridine(47) synthase [NAD(P)(+)] n=1 Tax=Mycena belliarum TaxID=1033014 RepID=A0AAD6TRG4_9AGAR|nr:zinc finger dihydrouridine synthase [Mycena belliae]KAJ7079279.1 zinc finger dihydrouridine synthase [Mycena belliae]